MAGQMARRVGIACNPMGGRVSGLVSEPAIKPAMRLFSDMMTYPMNWANFVLGNTPWPILIGIVTALGWYLGGLSMARWAFWASALFWRRAIGLKA